MKSASCGARRITKAQAIQHMMAAVPTDDDIKPTDLLVSVFANLLHSVSPHTKLAEHAHAALTLANALCPTVMNDNIAPDHPIQSSPLWPSECTANVGRLAPILGLDDQTTTDFVVNLGQTLERLIFAIGSCIEGSPFRNAAEVTGAVVASYMHFRPATAPSSTTH